MGFTDYGAKTLFSSTPSKIYLNLLAQGKVTEAKEFLQMAYLTNKDFITMVETITHTILYGARLDRYMDSKSEREHTDDETLLGEIGDALKLSMLFNVPYQALTTTARGRVVKHTIETMWMQSDDLETDRKLKAGAGAAVEAFIKQLFRNNMLATSLTQAAAHIVKNPDDKEITFDMLTDTIWEAIEDNMAGFLYYQQDTIQKGGYDAYVPMPSYLRTYNLLGGRNPNLEFYDELNSRVKWENITAGNPERISSWITMMIPYLRQVTVAGYSDDSDFVNGIDELKESQLRDDSINGRLFGDGDLETTESLAHMFNLAVALNGTSKTPYEDNLYIDHSFTTEEGEVITATDVVRKEQIFHHLATTYGIT